MLHKFQVHIFRKQKRVRLFVVSKILNDTPHRWMRKEKGGEFMNIWKGNRERKTFSFKFVRARKSGSHFLLLLNFQFSQFSILLIH